MTELPDYVEKKMWKKEYPEGVPHEIDLPDVSLVELTREKMNEFRDRVAFIFRDEETTYDEVKGSVEGFSSALSDLGVGKGDTVGLYMSNSPDWAIAYHGTLMTGALITGLSPLYAPREVGYQLNDSEAKTIILHERYYPNLEKVLEDTNVERIIVANFEGGTPGIEKGDGVYHMWDLIESHEPEPPKVEIGPEDAAVLQYTGGTTGRPKGCVLTHRNLVSNAMQNLAWYNYACEQKGLEYLTALSMLPWYHVYGQTCEVVTSGVVGSKGVIVSRFDPEEAMKLIEKYECQLFLGVPTMFLMMANHPKFEEYDLSSLIWVNSGAGPLPRELVRKFKEVQGVTITNGYGLSEASPVTHTTPPFTESRMKYGVLSVGIGYPNTLYGVIDPEKEEPEFLPLEKPGELVVSGPQVMKEYWQRPERTEEVLFTVEGRKWLRTGDIAIIDEDGYTYPIDRTKELINYKGHSVFPREIEEVYFEHSAVDDIAVIGVPDPSIAGENIKAFIVLNKDYEGKLSEDDLIEFGKENLAKYKYPRMIEFIDQIPKTETGKYLKRKLREKEEES